MAVHIFSSFLRFSMVIYLNYYYIPLLFVKNYYYIPLLFVRNSLLYKTYTCIRLKSFVIFLWYHIYPCYVREFFLDHISFFQKNWPLKIRGYFSQKTEVILQRYVLYYIMLQIDVPMSKTENNYCLFWVRGGFQ